MIGRDKITVNFRVNGDRGRVDGTEFSRVYYGVVITEQIDGKLEPFGSTLIFQNYYRLILPRSLDLSGASIVSVDFGTKVGARLDKPFVRVYDARGRVRHWEAVVRSS